MTKKVVLITGGSQGIGRGIAKAFAHAGYDVIITARNATVLEKTATDIESETGGNIIPVAMDMTNALSVEKLSAIIKDKFGKLDALIGNAAVLGDIKPMQTIEQNHFVDVFKANVFANQLLITHFHDLLLQAEHPRAVFVSTSPATIDGYANVGLYGASKSALETMVRSYARENLETKLRVNLVNPGRVRTSMRATVAPDEDPMILPTPDDIADVFLSLCQQDYTETAQIITISRKPS